VDEADAESHWVRWHEPYEDPESPLSVRLRLAQSAVRHGLNRAAPGPVWVVSLCAGQGRDLIDVVAGHERAADISALLVESDPELVESARERAAAAGLASALTVLEGDASLAANYVGWVPADLVLVCGVFGNISDADIAGVVAVLPTFCAPGASVIWTRHRKAPDLTPSIREWFAAAGFTEVSFEAPPDPFVLTVGHHRWVGVAPDPAPAFDPSARLFDFEGDGELPA
jgi:hypothetical protein